MRRNFTILVMLLLSIVSAWGLDIDKNSYYVISPRNNHDMYMKDTGQDIIQCNAGQDTYSYWRFIPTGKEGCYYVQNLFTKRYAQKVAETKEVMATMGTEPVEYFIMSTPAEGTDCFGLTSSDHSDLAFSTANCIALNWQEDKKCVQSYLAAVGTNHKSFWFFREVEPPSCLLGSHEYENGICSICGALNPDFVTKAEDGFYEISNGYQLEWYSALVNTGINDASARLMNDIDMAGIDHTPIAKNVDLRWRGTFDGQGHRILNLVINRPTENIQGLFGYLRGNSDSNTRVCNLIIDKSCSFTAYHQVGAIAGCSQGNQGLITLENIINEANVTAEGGTDAAALVGGQTGNAPTWRIRNIVNTGAITSTAESGYAGVVAGYYGNNAQNYQENIINLGIVTGFNGDMQLGRLSGTFINVFDISGTEGAGQGLDHDFTAEDVTIGRLCYFLNGNQSNIIFYQTIGEDNYPVPFATSKRVYMQGTLLCDGSPAGEEGTYSNSPDGSIVPPHTFVDGDFYCTVCGAFNDHFIEPVEGVLHMSTPLHLQWLAAYVATAPDYLEVVMDNDIDMDGIEFEGIGSLATPFLGHFDGQYHTISSLMMEGVTHDWSGFFNFIRGGSTIENLRLDENCHLTGAKGTALIGGCGMAGDVLLRNLGFEGFVDGQTTCAGAVLGANFQSIAKLTVENCYSTGSISGGTESAALVAWLGNNGAVISNCWTSATASGIQSEDKYAFRHDNAVVTNCYSLYGSQAQRFDYIELENGSLCYRLNGDQSTIRWYQNLDNGKQVDDFPTFMPTHGTVVVKAEMRCDGTYDSGNAEYSNNGEIVIPPHTFKDGFCEVCGKEDETYPFIRIFVNADHDNAQGYVNMGSNDGSGLAINNSVAEHWNQKWFESYQELKGLEPGLYKLRVQGLSRVKAWTDTDCEAYEEAELNPDYVQLYHNSQYYVDVNSKRISNLFMDIAKGKQENKIGTGTQTYHEASGLYVPNSLAACRAYFAKGLYWNEPIYFVVGSEQDTVRVGLENQMYLYGNWTVWDTWRLERVEGADDATATALILAQQEKNLQELDELNGQTQLAEEYEQAREALEQVTSLDEMLVLADQLSRLPEQIRLSHVAYINYSDAIDVIREDVKSRDHLNGHYADLLNTYLNENEEEVEGLPNGTYQSIIETRMLSTEELTAEISFVQELLNFAIKNSISEGTDITNLIVNPGMDVDANFTGWKRETSRIGTGDNNLSCQTGYGDIYYVAGSLNTAFRVWQDLEEGLPNGIYEIQIPAYYRPGNKGEGDVVDGTDIISADIFINDYHTPMMNIYKDVIPYSEAINGVNCRYDAVNDPDAPHNGQDTGSQDFDTGSGYVPHQRPGSSFAFSAGRYVNHAYAIVEDGKLTIGVRNTETPWYPNGLAVWGKFQLRYHGKSAEAIEQMTQNFESRLETLKTAQNEQDFYFNVSYIAEIENLIAQIKTTSDADAKMEMLKQINDIFNTVNNSYAKYQELAKLMEYLYEYGDAVVNEDPDLSNACYAKIDEIQNHLVDGNLTDEEAEQYAVDIRDDATIGGGFYVQGDLVDAEGNDMPYDTNTKVYPLQRQEDGTYTGIFTTQNRANLVHTDARAGIYFTRLDQTFKSNQPYRRFVTPVQNTHPLIAGAGQDYQMTGAKMKVTLNPKDSTVVFEPIEYVWNDRVFVCGSILDKAGAEHRWKNDEVAPLQHKGDGIYSGTVRFFEDYVYPGYATFIIMASRSTLEDEEYSTVTRPGWLEASYTATYNDCDLTPGVYAEDLIRGYGNSRRFRIEWTPGVAPKDYYIEFNMNARTIAVVPDNGDAEDVINSLTPTLSKDEGAVYDLSGRQLVSLSTRQFVNSLKKGLYIIDGKKVVIGK
ncbi:MAG: hypothetical protein J5524_07170 [Bacteroidaceae bacterium]|nr:hypothetical protein [Bacteroidaceae bacterium]